MIDFLPEMANFDHFWDPLFLTLFWQNCGFKGQESENRGVKKRVKNDPKMAKNDPFFDLFFDPFLVIFCQFTPIKTTKKRVV